MSFSGASRPADEPVRTSGPNGSAPLLWAAATVSLAAVAGSVYLSMGMGLKACPLCFYQRSFAMSLLAVLGVGLLTGAPAARLSLLTVPLAVAGLVVAGFHVYLELNGRLECPGGVLGLGTAPEQSLVAFAVILILLLADALPRPGNGPAGKVAVPVAASVGITLAVFCLVSNPPFPAAPLVPYASAPDICRPPFRSSK